MRTLQCTVPAAFDGRPLKHLLRGELGISSTLLKTLKWREGAILLNGAGVHVNAVVRTGDTVTVGGGTLHAPGAPLNGHGDHRIVMALAILATRTGGEIEGAEAVRKSYPSFWKDLGAFGIRCELI